MARMAPMSMFLGTLHVFLCIALGAAAQYPTRPQVPGVAFRLTPYYGLASIYLKEGTHIPVAQIHGSPQHEALTRRSIASDTSSDETHGTICPLVGPALDKLSVRLNFAFDMCHSADVLILKAMLKALNEAVESYLGTNICFTALVLDEIDGHLAQTAQQALQLLGLRQVLGTTWASRSLVHAHPPSVYNGTDMDLCTVLAIDYSSTWFNIGLYTIEETGLVDPVLGLVNGLRIGEKKQLEALEQALRDLAGEIPSDVESPNRLVIYGDNANNREIFSIIESVFGPDLNRDAYMSNSVYDGLAYIAGAAYEQMDTVNFEMRVPASFGCRWRSKLYHEGQTEL